MRPCRAFRVVFEGGFLHGFFRHSLSTLFRCSFQVYTKTVKKHILCKRLFYVVCITFDYERIKDHDGGVGGVGGFGGLVNSLSVTIIQISQHNNACNQPIDDGHDPQRGPYVVDHSLPIIFGYVTVSAIAD